jgi:hypothetical protein
MQIEILLRINMRVEEGKDPVGEYPIAKNDLIWPTFRTRVNEFPPTGYG